MLRSPLLVALVALAAAGLTRRARAQSASESVGRPNAGRLRDAAELTASPRVRPTHPAARFGTAEMVETIEAATRAVQRAHPGTPALVIGDLSRQRGGPFPPHLSHQAGRDADIGFYYLDASGQPLAQEAFVAIRADGRCAAEDATCRLDAARTWALVAAMLGDRPRVQYIVIAPHLRDLLLDAAVAAGASDALIARFRVVSARMDESAAHRDHMHVRVYCAPDDRRRCRDEGPLFPWYVFAPDMDEAFVAQARARGEARLAAEAAAEPRARARRHEARARREATERAVEEARIAAEARRARIRERRHAAREAELAERRRQRQARIARAEERRLAQERARRERDAFRALSPEAQRAELLARRAAAAEAERARRAEVVRVMRERAEARRVAAAERRAAMRAQHRAREAEEARRQAARREAYVAHLASRRAVD